MLYTATIYIMLYSTVYHNLPCTFGKRRRYGKSRVDTAGVPTQASTCRLQWEGSVSSNIRVDLQLIQSVFHIYPDSNTRFNYHVHRPSGRVYDPNHWQAPTWHLLYIFMWCSIVILLIYVKYGDVYICWRYIYAMAALQPQLWPHLLLHVTTCISSPLTWDCCSYM